MEKCFCWHSFMKSFLGEVSMQKKPIIGIVSKHEKIKNERQVALISDEVKNAIFANGGIAIGILASENEVNFVNGEDNFPIFFTQDEKENIIEQIKLCDGIIFQGGKFSEKYESWIARYTFDNDIPTLGICAGQNTMIRGVGGTTKKITNIKKHNQKWKDEVHFVFIEKSKFYNIVKCEKMVVNSRHDKVISNPTSNYKIAGVCDDGYFDVLEAPNKTFNIAVRFHPESLYKKYKEHNDIFVSFIEACKNNMKNNTTL